MSQNIPRYFDVRVVEKYIQQGELTRADYQAQLDSLPDEAENASDTDTRMGHAGNDRGGR